MKSNISTLFLFLTITGLSLTWHSKGHLKIARIAAIHLESTQSGIAASTWAKSLLAPFSKYCGEGAFPLTECGTWASKIKNQHWNSMENWHIISNPILEEGFTPATKVPDTSEETVITVINSNVKHISIGDPFGGGKSTLFGKSIALRNLVHFVADLHQPLHCGTLYSAKHPTGDQMGTLFAINFFGNKSQDNLHFLWDNMMEKEPETLQSPLTAAEYTSLTKEAQSVVNQFSKDPSFANQINQNYEPGMWARESYDLASSTVYPGVVEGEAPSADYIAKGKTILLRRMALAGKRLASLIELSYQQYLGTKKTSGTQQIM